MDDNTRRVLSQHRGCLEDLAGAVQRDHTNIPLDGKMTQSPVKTLRSETSLGISPTQSDKARLRKLSLNVD